MQTTPRNTAEGMDSRSYPFLRFWYTKDARKILLGIKGLRRD